MCVLTDLCFAGGGCCLSHSQQPIFLGNRAGTAVAPSSAVTGYPSLSYRAVRLFATLLFVVVFASVCEAATFTIAWDANTEPDLAGYRVLVGTAPGRYTQTYNVGIATSKTLTLPDGMTYYLVVVAYNTEGLVSSPSREVQWSLPAIPPQSQFTTTAGSNGHLASRLLQWSAVSDAEVYYLYVGTAPGLSNVVNTGEITATSYTLPILGDSVFYARIYTRQGGVWRAGRDLIFRPAIVETAQLIVPMNGAHEVGGPLTFQWTTVPTAETYYLYVGTQSGLRDIVDSHEMTQNTFTMPSFPAGRHLYARVFTRIDGQWLTSREVQFDTATRAHFRYPLAGTRELAANETFSWTTVGGADAYYLWVGTTSGAKDILNSGEIQTTSRDVTGLPAGRTLYASIHTRVQGVWLADEITIQTAAISHLTTPVSGDNGAADAFRWIPVTGARAYYLYVGTSSGAKDLVDTGELHTLESPMVPLPADQTLWARVWTDINGAWRPNEISFKIRGAALIEPVETAATSGQTFRWTDITNADAYYLYVGTAPGAKDVIDSGETSATSYTAGTLPAGTTLYVTLWTKAGGSWRASTAIITTP